MPRSQSSTLTDIFASYSKRDTLDIYKSDGNVIRLSRGGATRSSNVYQDYIRQIDDLVSTLEQSVDRVSVTCQNVSSELGFSHASSLRLLDYAIADYGRIYQSNLNPALLEDVPQVFRGVLANAESTETKTKFELVVDYESLWNCIAARTLGPKSPWTYKNGIESTSTSSLPEGNNTRQAYKDRGREWEFGGWEFFEEPIDSAPGSGGNAGGIGGGIGGGINPPATSCFALDTLIWTLNGDVPIGDLPLRKLNIPIAIFSFDERTGKISEDEILEISEHETSNWYDFEFQHARLSVTSEHPILTRFGKFTKADDLKMSQSVKVFQKEWLDSRLTAMSWNTDETRFGIEKSIIVRNLKVKNNKTYFANRVAVHNKPFDPYQP